MKANPCFRNRILSSQQVAKIQIRLNLGRLLGATKFCCGDKRFSVKVLQSVRRCDVSLGRVAATSPPTCAQGVIDHRDVLLQLVA